MDCKIAPESQITEAPAPFVQNRRSQRPGPLTKNVVLVIAYDGNDFLGWQKTSEGPSIEEALQSVLEQILQEKIVLQAASRTDAGVHANGQIVHFITKKNVDLAKLCSSLNSLLPKAITVVNAFFAEKDFHPTLHNQGKEYHYHICNSSFQLPQHRFYSWHCLAELQLTSMREASKYFVGKHDFAAMCNVKKNESYEDTIRDVQRIDIIELEGKRLRFEVEGKAFLYKMVRNIVGTLIYVGQGKLAIKDIPEIMQSADRKLAGVTAPAHGLCLNKVLF